MSILALSTLSLAIIGGSEPLGTWRAWLDCPGGDLPFGIELELKQGELRATFLNGPERIEVPRAVFEDGTLVLEMPHYDSRIEARLDGDNLSGTWRRRRGLEEWTEMSFHARRGRLPRFHEVDAAPSDELDGRWSVRFSSSEDRAVGLFQTDAMERLEGTFLTTTGDYRFLSGDFAGGGLRLSCFDGAHAFLFTAHLQPDGTLSGDFWSRDSWHETWTAKRDIEAVLPNAFEQTTWQSGWSLGDVIFPDLDGNPRSLADPAFAGKARILQVFGSWCPNCNDEARYLSELEERYGARGLSILGLAFELTGDFDRDAQQVRRYQARNDVDYPVLLAGTADKQVATRAFPALDFVRSYPTTIFLRRDGSVRAVHSGFTGPATGEAHVRLRGEFEQLIEELLAEPEQDHEQSWGFLRDRRFVEEGALGSGRELTFSRANGEWRALLGNPTQREAVSVPLHLSGPTLIFGDEILRIDRDADALLDPRRFGRRFVPVESRGDQARQLDEAELIEFIQKRRGSARREGIVRLTKLRLELSLTGLPRAMSWLADESLQVELAAIWSAGVLRERSVRELLLLRLEDPNAAVRRESVIALERVGFAGQLRSRVEALQNDPDPYVRQAVARALNGD